MTDLSTVNRADLRWALTAVQPHVDKLTKAPYICLDGRATGVLYVYATDTYTFGIARVPFTGHLPEIVYLPRKELQSLATFVKPKNKAQESYSVDLAVEGPEMHVGLGDEQPGDEYLDTAVYETGEGSVTLSFLLGAISRLSARAVETREYTFLPSLWARFGAAERETGDRLRIDPHIAHASRAGEDITVAVVTVGKDFIGGLAGPTHEGGIESVLESWLPEEIREAA